MLPVRKPIVNPYNYVLTFIQFIACYYIIVFTFTIFLYLVTEITNKLCVVIRDDINEYERTSGLDLGGRITTVEPISYDVNGCSLTSAAPSPYLNSDLPTSGHTQYTVVKPIELAVRVSINE